MIPVLLLIWGTQENTKTRNYLSQAKFRSKRHINKVKNRLLRECITWSPSVGCSEIFPPSWLHAPAVPPTLCLWGGSWGEEKRSEAIGFPVCCSKVTVVPNTPQQPAVPLRSDNKSLSIYTVKGYVLFCVFHGCISASQILHEAMRCYIQEQPGRQFCFLICACDIIAHQYLFFLLNTTDK